MRKHSKLLLAALTAILALSFATSTATANRGFSFTPNERILIIFPRFIFGGGFGNVTCGITLHGSLHRTIPKIEGTLVGMIESMLINITGCTESFGVGNMTDARVLTLPWHLRYVSFTGTLPVVRTIRLIQLGFSILFDYEILGGDARCLYLMNQGEDLAVEARGTITSVSLIREAANRPVRPPSTANCPDLSLSGSGTLTDSAGRVVTVRLI